MSLGREVLVLANQDDALAAQVASRLADQLGRSAVSFLRVEELIHHSALVHEVREGRDRTVIRRPDGSTVRSEAVGLVFSRVRQVWPLSFARSEDREYAAMELHALLLSVLSSFPCPVIPRPSPRGLGGPIRSTIEWMHLARLAGLAVPRMRVTTNERRFPAAGLQRVGVEAFMAPDDVPAWRSGSLSRVASIPVGARASVLQERVHGFRRVTLIGHEVLGAPSASFAAGCRRLGEIAEIPFLRIIAGRGEHDTRWLVHGASAVPPEPDAQTAAAMADFLVTSLGESRSARR